MVRRLRRAGRLDAAASALEVAATHAAATEYPSRHRVRPATFTILARSQLDEGRLDAARRTVHLALAELRRRHSIAAHPRPKASSASAAADPEAANPEAATYNLEADGVHNSSLAQLVCLAVEVCTDGGSMARAQWAMAEGTMAESAEYMDCGPERTKQAVTVAAKGGEGYCALAPSLRTSPTQATANAIELLANVGPSRRSVARRELEARGFALDQLPPAVNDALG